MAAFKCRKCGQQDDPDRWAKNTIRIGFCHSCSYWLGIVITRNDSKRVFANGAAYHIGTAFCDYDRGLNITFQRIDDGTIIHSPNTWHNGQIPSAFKRALPDTHRIVATR